MRPQFTLRARGAGMALGALCSMTITLGALPGNAQSSEPTGSSPVASAATVQSIVPGVRRLNVVAGRRAVVTGYVRPGIAGRTVLVQARVGQRWKTVARATTRSKGRFVVRFRAQRPDSTMLRLRSDGSRRMLGRLNVYRTANASWYGPGLYGNSLSCGGTLSPSTLGVAHKSLPCGTKVTLRRGSRIVRVRVIDRGPFVGGREFDLTAATKERLRFAGVGRVLVAS